MVIIRGDLKVNIVTKMKKVFSNPFIIIKFIFIKGYFDFLPDKQYIKLKYKCITEKSLNLKHVKTFNEKLQWLKLYDRNPLYVQLVNKYEVREYIKKTIGEQYLIPILGYWDYPDQIDFKKLPEQFVLKTTHDSGGVFIFDRNKDNVINEAKKFLLQRLKINYYKISREWPYKDCKRMIIAEKKMTDESGIELKDYKLFCFNGDVKLIQVDFDRFYNHRRNLYTCDWKYINERIEYPNDSKVQIEKPIVLEEMLNIASKLSVGLPHVRVDLYVINEKVYFGELTFYHGSGYECFSSDIMERELGDCINLNLAYTIK